MCIVCIPGTQEPLCLDCPYNPANQNSAKYNSVGDIGYRVGKGGAFLSLEEAVECQEQCGLDIEVVEWNGSKWVTYNPDKELC